MIGGSEEGPSGRKKLVNKTRGNKPQREHNYLETEMLEGQMSKRGNNDEARDTELEVVGVARTHEPVHNLVRVGSVLTLSSSRETQQSLGKFWIIGTRNCRHPFQCPRRTIKQMRLNIRINFPANARNWGERSWGQLPNVHTHGTVVLLQGIQVDHTCLNITTFGLFLSISGSDCVE